MSMFQLMDWLCSKSVQSLGQTALVQNKKSKQGKFWFCSEENFNQNLKKFATKPFYNLFIREGI